MFTTEEFTGHKELSKEILHIDPHIRFVGLINSRGRLTAGSVRENTVLKVKPNECEMLYMEAVLKMRMHQEFDHCLGPVNFCMSHRKNFIITKFPFGKVLVYVSADNTFDFTKTPFKIMEILNKRLEKTSQIIHSE